MARTTYGAASYQAFFFPPLSFTTGIIYWFSENTMAHTISEQKGCTENIRQIPVALA